MVSGPEAETAKKSGDGRLGSEGSGEPTAGQLPPLE
jgi:hypothetical protein